MSVRVRIAPSPTGDPHVGTAYMALFNLIFAKRFGGKFILRIEDTDQTRSRPEHETSIIDALKWCQIEWDEGPDVGGPFGPYRQSERTEIYRKYAYQLLERGYAYKCFATAQELAEMRQTAVQEGKRGGYDRRYRDLSLDEVKRREEAGQPFVIRLKIPLSGECVYVDEIKGRITVPWADIDDQVLLKSDGFPTYHLANVVDDHLMQITHVIRGDEWMTSTPKHIFLYEAFGWKAPIFMHMPLLLGKDGKKLSKRKNPTSIFYFRDSGFLPEALTNFLTLMGYRMPDEREIYTVEEITQTFDPKRIGVSGAYFDIQKLQWLNQKKIIDTIPTEHLWDRISQWMLHDSFMRQLMPLVHQRLRTFGDFLQICDFFFINDLKYTPELLCPKNCSSESVAFLLQALIWNLDAQEDWTGTGLEKAAQEVAELFAVPYKKILIPVLFAVMMGKHQGPSLYESVTILGKYRARVRLLQAIEALGGISNKKMDLLKKKWDQKNCQEFFGNLSSSTQP